MEIYKTKTHEGRWDFIKISKQIELFYLFSVESILTESTCKCRFIQLVLSDCNVFSVFTQIILSDCNSCSRIQKSEFSNSREGIAIRENQFSNSREWITNSWVASERTDCTIRYTCNDLLLPSFFFIRIPFFLQVLVLRTTCNSSIWHARHHIIKSTSELQALMLNWIVNVQLIT